MHLFRDAKSGKAGSTRWPEEAKAEELLGARGRPEEVAVWRET